MRLGVGSSTKRNCDGEPVKVRGSLPAGSPTSPSKSLRFCGKAIRVFERELLEGKSFKCGCFAQDRVGDWWLCVSVAHSVEQTLAPNEVVGIDLGLRETAATNDEDRLEAGHFYRNIEHKIAQAQRRGHKRQATRLHRQAARRRRDALHKFSTKIVKLYQNVLIGNVSSLKLIKTRMAKSVLDSGWGILRNAADVQGPLGRQKCIDSQ